MTRARDGLRSALPPRPAATSGAVLTLLLLLTGMLVALSLLPWAETATAGSPTVSTVERGAAQVTAPDSAHAPRSSPCRTFCPTSCSPAGCVARGETAVLETASTAPQLGTGPSVAPDAPRLVLDTAAGRRPPVSRQALSISRT